MEGRNREEERGKNEDNLRSGLPLQEFRKKWGARRTAPFPMPDTPAAKENGDSLRSGLPLQEIRIKSRARRKMPRYAPARTTAPFPMPRTPAAGRVATIRWPGGHLVQKRLAYWVFNLANYRPRGRLATASRPHADGDAGPPPAFALAGGVRGCVRAAQFNRSAPPRRPIPFGIVCQTASCHTISVASWGCGPSSPCGSKASDTAGLCQGAPVVGAVLEGRKGARLGRTPCPYALSG
jgi:hypothetical protein